MNKKFLKMKVLILTMIAFMLVIAGCAQSSGTTSGGDSKEDSDTIKIGFILSFTGPLAPLSEGIKQGFELYLEEHGGKIGGKKVELKFEDDEGNPQVGLRKYRQLVHSEKVDLLVGPTNSSIALALRDEVNKDKIAINRYQMQQQMIFHGVKRANMFTVFPGPIGKMDILLQNI